MKKRLHYRRYRSGAIGFTLIELIIALAIAGVITGLAAPSMRTFMLNSRLSSTSNELLRSIQTARSEATKRQGNVVICTSSNPNSTTPTCSKTSIAGWIVFQDSDSDWDRGAADSLIETHVFEPTKISIVADNSWRLSFAATGFANPVGTTPATQTPTTSIVICDSRGNAAVTSASTESTARGVQVVATGRVRITRVKSEITTLLNSTHINSTCPP